MYLNDIDLIKQELFTKSVISDATIIKQIIEADRISQAKQNMYYGCEYYESENTEIKSRNFSYLINGRNIEDKFRANNKIANGFLKVLIDQKVNYSLSKPISIENADQIKDVLKINTFMQKLAKEASKKGVGWLYVNYDENGKIVTKVIPSEEIIPIFDTQFEDKIIQIIRYYTMNELVDNKLVKSYNVEVWDDKEVSYYTEINGNFMLDYGVALNPASHWTTTTYELEVPTEIVNHSWGRIPFIPLWNNEDHLTDLNAVKDHIDSYDKCISDFSNNLEDIQDSIIKLVNYGGMTDNLSELLEYMKMYKVLPLDSSGNAEYMTMEIPIQAKELFLRIIRENIFEFGQGVDMQKAIGGNVTNVVIKSQYAGLDLKANDFENNVSNFLMELFWFANELSPVKINLEDIKISYNRSLILNDLEQVQMCVQSKGTISNKTIISKHPWVSDAQYEIDQMEDEKENDLKSVYGSIDIRNDMTDIIPVEKDKTDSNDDLTENNDIKEDKQPL